MTITQLIPRPWLQIVNELLVEESTANGRADYNMPFKALVRIKSPIIHFPFTTQHSHNINNQICK